MGSFFDLLVARYQGDIRVLTGHVVKQVIDEFNRPASPSIAGAIPCINAVSRAETDQ